MKALLDRVVSGGQTGADRAALDWAIGHRIRHGGWCPKGRLAEDGPIDRRYRLRETPTAEYAQRTEWNVRHSDGTVVFSIQALLTGGSRSTFELARREGKPVLHLWRDGGPSRPDDLLLWFLAEYQIRVLNVAGPRASQEPEVAAFVTRVLDGAWSTSR
jgi:hypothetical protein